jgi:hypothetical protein
MEIDRQITKVVKRRSLKKKNDDCAYWLKQTPEARIAAVEQARAEYHGWTVGAEPRLQRVITIVKRKNNANSR